MLRNLSGRPAGSPFLVRLGGEPPGPISAALLAEVYSIPGLGLEAREYADGQWPDQEHPSPPERDIDGCCFAVGCLEGRPGRIAPASASSGGEMPRVRAVSTSRA